MPGYRGHLLGGLALSGGALFGAVFFKLIPYEPKTLLALLCISLLASLFPDVDTDSKGQNLFYSLLAALDLGLMIKGLYKWAAILGFCAMLPALGHHRGWTHTWWAMLLIPMPIIVLPMLFYGVEMEKLLPFYLAAVVGYFSHLLLDREF